MFLKYSNYKRLFGRTAKHLKINISQSYTKDEVNTMEIKKMRKELDKCKDLVKAIALYHKKKEQSQEFTKEVTKGFKIPDAEEVAKRLDFFNGLDILDTPFEQKTKTWK